MPDQPLRSELVPQTHGGALQRGNTVHGLGTFRGVTPTVRAKSDEIRAQLAREVPGIATLSLPTVELMCQAFARAILYHEVIMEYAEGTRTRRWKGQTLSGIEACPAHIMQQADRASYSAARLARDLGLDLTGRMKASTDDAIAGSLRAPGVRAPRRRPATRPASDSLADREGAERHARG